MPYIYLMPLYKEWDSDPYSLAAIWKIEEPESFFRDATGLDEQIRSDKRRIERLAGRFLLKFLEKEFPLHHILPDEHDKPRLPGNQYYFSISHSFPYVAAVLSPTHECGIDIQCWHPRMLTLQQKFLSASEQAIFSGDERLITIAWTAKEAIYKWNGKRGVDFIEHLPISSFKNIKKNEFYSEIRFPGSQKPSLIPLRSFIEADFAISYVENTLADR